MAKTNIFKEAKKVQRLHPRLTWQEAIQKASKQHKKVGTVKKKPAKKKARQTGTSNRVADRKRVARPPGPRKPAGSRVVTYTERRKNRSDLPGSLTGVSATMLVSALRKRLVDKEDKLVLKKYRAVKKTDKRKLQKEISATKTQLRKLK